MSVYGYYMFTMLFQLAILCYVIHMSSGEISYSAPHPKVWWAKQIEADIYTAGRLTERQLKYAVDAGFQTIIPQYYFNFTESIGDEVLPSTEHAQTIVKELGGVDFYMMAMPDEDIDEKTRLERLTHIFPFLKKPILYYCNHSDSATFTSLLFLASQKLEQIAPDKKISSEMLFSKAATLGFSFDSMERRELIADITGEDIVSHPPQPDVSMKDWYQKYWLMKPLYANWYDAGQVQRNYIPSLKEAGFRVVLNTRRGVTLHDGTPAQEEVFLLNIKDGTGTYDGQGRQATNRLLETRIDPDRSTRFITETVINYYYYPSLNYEARNRHEFGDEVGYNETTERNFVEEMGIEYIFTPVGGEYKYSKAMVDEYMDTWQEVGRWDHVFLHCRSGYRAGVVGILSAGLQYNLDCEWAKNKAKAMGYHYDLKDPIVFDLFDEILCTDR